MGITFKVGANYSVDMQNYGLDVGSVGAAEITSYNSTKIVGYAGGVKIVITGSRFTHDEYGYLTGGEIRGVQESYGGSNVMSLSGISLSVKQLANAIVTPSPADDLALWKAALKGDDKLSGGKYSDILLGYDGNDKLYGNAGNDKLNGGAGADKLVGGAGRDNLFGGAGADTFVFTKISDSTVAGSGRDTIYDFVGASGDCIDLTAIDANTKVAGDQAFSFIGTAGFSGKASELRYDQKATGDYIYGDVNGDGQADFSIRLDDAMTLTKDYFLL